MKLLYEGKTKDVYELPNGNCLLRFKDTATGVDGVFDPGANHVGLTMEGAGKTGLEVTKFFFEELQKRGISTHYVNADIEKNEMEVKKATVFGKGVEVICRFKATGSFMRRYGAYIEEGTDLPAYVEITIKDDDREDPLITKEGLVVLGILTAEEYDELVRQTKEIATIVKDILAEKDMTLYDIKFEFARTGENKEITLIDEISGGNMRVYKNGEIVNPLDFPKHLF